MTLILISLLSVTCWTISLFLPAFIFYDGVIWSGGRILSQGWLGPLQLNFAWYANIFYFIAIFSTVMRYKSALVFSSISVLLSLNSFSFSTTDGYNLLYGYGLGFVLWNISILLLLCLAGINNFKVKKTLLSIIFLTPIAIFLMYICYCSHSYNSFSNKFEQNFGKSHQVFFKKYEVCKDEIPEPVQKHYLNGPLEVVNPSNISPFDRPSTLLDWGIPRVRFGNFDYFFSINNNKKTLVAKQKEGPASATLLARKTYDKPVNGKMSIYVKLTSNDADTLIFEEEWAPEVQEHLIMCPRFHSAYPGEAEQPRKVLMDSLIIDPLFIVPSTSHKEKILNVIITSENQFFGPKDLNQLNTHCPDNVGFINDQKWKDLRRNNTALDVSGKPFKIDKLFYFTGTRMNKSICIQESIYPYYINNNEKNIYIEISKRSQDSFHEEWAISANIYGLGKKTETKQLYINNIEDLGGVVRFQLVDSESSTVYTIESKVE